MIFLHFIGTLPAWVKIVLDPLLLLTILTPVLYFFVVRPLVYQIILYKQAELKNRESEERFRIMADDAPIMLWMSDAEGKALFQNKQWLMFTGLRAEEITGETWTERLHPEDRPRCLDSYFAALKERRDFQLEYRLRGFDGEYHWIMDRGRPRRLTDGAFLGYIGSNTDITELKRAEETLRMSKEKYSRAVEESPDAIVISRLSDGMILEVNKGCRQISGYSSEEVLGKTVTDIPIWSNLEQRGAFIRELKKKGSVVDTELEFIRKNGQLCPVVISATIQEINGEKCVFMIGRDVTERKQAEKKKQELEQQLLHAQKMEAVGQLTGGIAHDFNNLLAIIQANLELLGKRLGDDGKAARHLQKSLFNVQRGAELTQRLLAFSRKQLLAPAVLDLNTLIRGMHDLLQRTLGEAIAIEIVCAGGLWRCFADASQVENALLNFALNARDAMPDGGKLTIETANTVLDNDYAATRVDVIAGQYVMLAVTDTGTGMSNETLAHAFEPFFTTKGPDQGSGLGLSMVYGFAKQSKGHIAIYSEEGEGTTIKLYLPRYQGTDDAGEKLAVTAEIPEGQNETVLVVEDESDLLEVLVNQLESLGYIVLSAKDGNMALEVFDENEGIDLLLTDVILPGDMNGRDITDALQHRRPDMKVLYMSGYTENAVVHQGRLDGVIHLLRKPFTLAALAGKVKEVLSS